MTDYSLAANPWAEPDVALARLLRNRSEAAQAVYRDDPKLVVEHYRQEESFRTSGYRVRQITELIQNAADAISSSGRRGRIEVRLTPNALYCANEGAPFDADGVNALSHAYLSEKRDDQIGRYGLGFKSVLAITTNPQILSRSVSFEFGSDEAGLMMARASKQPKLPILRIPTPLDPSAAFANDEHLQDLGRWATTIVKLPLDRRGAADEHFSSLEVQIRGFRPEFLLFAHSVSALRLSVMAPEQPEYSVEYTCEDLGNGRFTLSDGGSPAEWRVFTALHAPSLSAVAEANEAIVRKRVTISFAAPIVPEPMGSFWANFPLDERTSARGIFNAPWALNEDRTRIDPESRFNAEIVDSFARLFLDSIPLLRTPTLPSSHLDYMPSRPREFEGPIDKALVRRIRNDARWRRLIPDCRGELRHPLEITYPPDCRLMLAEHELFAFAPHTTSRALHPDCFRLGRARSHVKALVYALRAETATHPDDVETMLGQREPDRPFEPVGESLLSLPEWLTQLANSPEETISYCTSAILIASRYRKTDDGRQVETAHFIPAGRCLVSPANRRTVFLPLKGGSPEGFQCVDAELVRNPKVATALRDFGFQPLTASRMLDRRFELARDGGDPSDWRAFWDSVDTVDDLRTWLQRRQIEDKRSIRVENEAGHWVPCGEILRLGALGIGPIDEERALSARFARWGALLEQCGIVTAPVSVEFRKDPLYAAYLEFAHERVVSRGIAGAHPDFSSWRFEGKCFGPVGLVAELASAGRDDEAATWSKALLDIDSNATWKYYDGRNNLGVEVPAPHHWAVVEFGRARTSLGVVATRECVDPALDEYAAVLPVPEASSFSRLSALPKKLDDVPDEVLIDALEHFAPGDEVEIGHRSAARFDLVALRALGRSDRAPSVLLAAVGGRTRAVDAGEVFVVGTPEALVEFATTDLPYVYVDSADDAKILIDAGLRDGDQEATVEVLPESPSAPALIADLFARIRIHLRRRGAEDAQFVVCESIILKDSLRGTTSRATSARQGDVLYIDHDPRPKEARADFLALVNDSFDLRIDQSELNRILENADNAEVQELVRRSHALADDSARLLALVDPSDLRRPALEAAVDALGLPSISDEEMSRLFLSTYGVDSLKELASVIELRHSPYLEVPHRWAGSPETRAFVSKLGFDERFAGQRHPRPRPVETVSAPPQVGDLHDYQEEAVERILPVLGSPTGRAAKALVELPTGSGKTRVAVESLIRALKAGSIAGTGPILWIAQTKELCEQAAQTWILLWQALNSGAPGREPDRRPLSVCRFFEGIMPDEPASDLSVVVATDAMLDQHLDDPAFSWIYSPAAVVVDEAHRAGSTRYHKVFTRLGVDVYHAEHPLLGLSATPFTKSAERSNTIAARFGRNLIVSDSLGGDPIRALQDRGFLARPTHAIIEGARVRFSEAERIEAREKNLLPRTVLDRFGSDRRRNARIVDHVLATAKELSNAGRRPSILVFMPSVLSAQAIAAALTYRGMTAASVSGDSSGWHRRFVVEAFRTGEIEVLVNCDVLTQGFDAPRINALYVAKPTLSQANYVQMVGRGLRGPHNGGSESCLVVDLEDTIRNGIDIDLAYRDFESFWEPRS